MDRIAFQQPLFLAFPPLTLNLSLSFLHVTPTTREIKALQQPTLLHFPLTFDYLYTSY